MSQIGWSPVCHIVLVAFTLYLEDYCNKPKSCICSTIGLSGLHPWDCFDQKCVSAGNWTAIARKKALEIELHKVGLTSHRKPKIWQGTLDLKNGHRGAWRAHQSLITNPEIASDCMLVFEDDAKFTPEFVRNRRQILRKTIKFMSGTSPWDIFFLGSNPVQMQRLENIENVVRLHSWALFAYVVSDTGRALFANRTFPRATGGTIDGISHDSNFAFGVYPSVAIHPSGVYSDTLGSRRSFNLSMMWSRNEELLFEYASDPKKCWPRMAEISNFGAIYSEWYATRKKIYDPLMICH